MKTFLCLAGLFLTIIANPAWADSLQDCSGQFIEGDVNNAPTLHGSDPTQPYENNVHLCFRDDSVSFFALEYWPEEFSPRWAAYRLDPANYGADGCSTFTRAVGNCYIKAPTWQEALDCDNDNYKGDPFHADQMLKDPKLGSNPFSNTGHDRGHIAPRAAFSWHVCGNYQTFSMANMSLQCAYLNQDIWRYLEQQVLTWAVDEGPLYLVSGVTYRKFPYYRFQVYSDGALDPQYRYDNPQTMLETVTQHQIYADEHPDSGDLLHPKRDANPDKVKDIVKDMRMPTGYFKVIYRPAMNGEDAKAIGFFLPHTYQNLNELTKVYGMDKINRDTEDFWFFRSRIDLIEEMGKVRFPAIPDELKHGYSHNDWWDQRRTAREIRGNTCGRGTPQGVLADATKEERLEACTDQLVPAD